MKRGGSMLVGPKTTERAGGAGGSMSIRPGAGDPPGAIRFELADGSEFMRMEGDGRFFVRGDLVTTDKGIYAAFADYVAQRAQP